MAVSVPLAIRSARSASSTAGTCFAAHVIIALLWRECRATCGEGDRQSAPVARNERKPLDLGERFGQDQRCYAFDRLPEPLPPSVGALVFSGRGLLLPVYHPIPCRKKRRIS